ncbi:MAG: hypothetical protein II333_08150 [Clostridia bacterium]|jgi:hypothetical protein|nr:hypothetical protein [Clostridia bacterium]MBQ2278526.1 hypothetical protein [Clostridia bacterium]MBR5311371.1 hypothetical protein [Clostridia bacterium]
MNHSKNLTKKLALGGVMAALCVALLYLLGMTAFDLSVLVLCALMTMLVMVECGVKTTWIYAAVTSVLALLLLPSKLFAIQYVLFSALYPIFKMYFERMNQVFAWMLKLSCLDSMLMLCLILVRTVFTNADFFPFAMPTLIVGTLFFIFFDIVMTMCISVYMIKLRKIFKLQK